MSWLTSNTANALGEKFSAAVGVLFIPFMGYFCFMVASGLPADIRGSRAIGVQGTFLPEYEDCSGSGGCGWLGTFTSYSGDVRHDVYMHPGENALGRVRPAVDSGASNVVYPIEGSNEWLWAILAMLITGGYAVGGSVMCGYVLRERFSPDPAPVYRPKRQRRRRRKQR